MSCVDATGMPENILGWAVGRERSANARQSFCARLRVSSQACMSDMALCLLAHARGFMTCQHVKLYACSHEQCLADHTDGAIDVTPAFNFPVLDYQGPEADC